MMDLLLKVADLIQDAGLATVGTDLFINTIPAEVPAGIMLREPFTGAAVDDGMAGFFNTEFQVIVRGPDPEAAYRRCEDISTALRVNRLTIDNIEISWMKPKTLPIMYPKGNADDTETSCRISVGYGRITP